MNYVTSDTELTAIADAIRAKAGTPNEMLTYPDEYISAIGGLHSNGEIDTLHGLIRSKVTDGEDLWDGTNEKAPITPGKHYQVTLTYTPAALDTYVEFGALYVDSNGDAVGNAITLREEFAAGTYDGITPGEFTFLVDDMPASSAEEGESYFLTMDSLEFQTPSAVEVIEYGPKTAAEILAAVNGMATDDVMGVSF